MNSTARFISLLAASIILSLPVARGQLQLTGYTTGSFDDLSQPNTTVSNAPDGSWATFSTGVATSGSTQSSIRFTNVNFTNVNSGDPIQIGLFDIKNGVTVLGSGAHTARFNLGVELTAPEGRTVALSTILFNIDHTHNEPALIPDSFSVSFDQPAPIFIDNTRVQFNVHVDPMEFSIAENATIQKGDITVTFTPVPEPSTYAVMGSALLFGLVAYRRVRSRQMAGVAPSAA